MKFGLLPERSGDAEMKNAILKCDKYGVLIRTENVGGDSRVYSLQSNTEQARSDRGPQPDKSNSALRINQRWNI